MLHSSDDYSDVRVTRRVSTQHWYVTLSQTVATVRMRLAVVTVTLRAEISVAGRISVVVDITGLSSPPHHQVLFQLTITFTLLQCNT